MNRRRRALLFALLAAASALGSVLAAARYRDGSEIDYGPSRPVVVAARELAAGEKITAAVARRSLSGAAVPERFLPPDALGSPREALGVRPAATVPAGSYLLRSQLGAPGRERRAAPALPKGLLPVSVTVAGAGSLAALRASGSSRGRVDVVAAGQPGIGGAPRVRVLARAAPLLGLRPLGGRLAGEPGRSEATLALSRAAALEVIEAENFASEVRLLPRGWSR